MKKEAILYKKLDRKIVQCFLCAHRCKIAESHYGFCGVRKNENGTLYTYVYGEVIAAHVDPIEKKPLYHFLPGSMSYSIATIGCNFKCGFCQNWQISQATLDNAELRGRLTGQASKKGKSPTGYELKPEEVVREAKKSGCKSIAYTYTEPTIFFEYAVDTAKLAKKENLKNIFITNGYMTKEAIDTIKPFLDAANIDLKSFNNEMYKKICGGSLNPVLESIAYMKKTGIWIEVTTLVVPGMNDSEEELKEIAGFLVDTGKDIPWHISRFHPDYEYEAPKTPLSSLKAAEKAGRKAGLKYVYLGNVLEEGNTSCYNCGGALIERSGYKILSKNIEKGKCIKCKSVIEGVW